MPIPRFVAVWNSSGRIVQMESIMLKSMIIGAIASLIFAYLIQDTQGLIRDVVNPIEIKVVDVRLFWSWIVFLLFAGLSYVIHRRSEEHTSELQSLMRRSYSVF